VTVLARGGDPRNPAGLRPRSFVTGALALSAGATRRGVYRRPERLGGRVGTEHMFVKPLRSPGG